MKKLIGMIMAIAMTFALATTAFAAETTVTVTSDPNKTGDGYEQIKPNGNTWDIGISATFVAGADPYEVKENYYVIVKYNVEPKLVFTVGKDAYTWNVNETGGAVSSANHALKANFDGEWSGTATVGVTVENWSNRDVKAGMKFTSATAGPDNGVLKDITVKSEAQNFAAAPDNSSTKTKWDGESHALTLQSAAAGVGFEEGNKAESPVSGAATFTINAANKGVTGAISKSNAVIGTLTITLNVLAGNNFPTASQP